MGKFIIKNYCSEQSDEDYIGKIECNSLEEVFLWLTNKNNLFHKLSSYYVYDINHRKIEVNGEKYVRLYEEGCRKIFRWKNIK